MAEEPDTKKLNQRLNQISKMLQDKTLTEKQKSMLIELKNDAIKAIRELMVVKVPNSGELLDIALKEDNKLEALIMTHCDEIDSIIMNSKLFNYSSFETYLRHNCPGFFEFIPGETYRIKRTFLQHFFMRHPHVKTERNENTYNRLIRYLIFHNELEGMTLEDSVRKLVQTYLKSHEVIPPMKFSQDAITQEFPEEENQPLV